MVTGDMPVLSLFIVAVPGIYFKSLLFGLNIIIYTWKICEKSWFFFNDTL